MLPIPRSLTPPPPHLAERRRHERFELFASVKLETVVETLVLSARDISLGGVRLEANEALRVHLPLGSRHEIMVFDACDAEVPPVHLEAQVMRHDSVGVALMFVLPSPVTLRRLGKLLESLKPRR